MIAIIVEKRSFAAKITFIDALSYLRAYIYNTLKLFQQLISNKIIFTQIIFFSWVN